MGQLEYNDEIRSKRGEVEEDKQTFDEADGSTWPPRISIKGKILCPTFNSNQQSPIRKGSRKMREFKKISPTRKDLPSQGMNVNPMLL